MTNPNSKLCVGVAAFLIGVGLWSLNRGALPFIPGAPGLAVPYRPPTDLFPGGASAAKPSEVLGSAADGLGFGHVRVLGSAGTEGRPLEVAACRLGGETIDGVTVAVANAEGALLSLTPGRYAFYVRDAKSGLIEQVVSGAQVVGGRALVLDMAAVDFERHQRGSFSRLGAELERDPKRVSADGRMPDEIVVSFKPEAAFGQIAALNHRLGTRTRKWLRLSGAYRLELPADLFVEEAVQRYSASPLVEFAEPNYLTSFSSRPNDGGFASGKQWGLDNPTDPLLDIDAPEAWDIETGDGSVVVAVVDSGVNLSHPELQANAWVNPGEIPGNGIDDDHNGYVDDVNGYFFNALGPGDADVSDPLGHGTTMASIIGAKGNNGSDAKGEGMSGVIWNVRLMAVKVSNMEMIPSGRSDAAEVGEAIRYAANEGAHIINMSFNRVSDKDPRILRSAIDFAFKTKGCALFASAGNINGPIDTYPALYTNEVLTVGAVNAKGVRCQPTDWPLDHGKPQGSAFGPALDIMAPGDEVYAIRYSPIAGHFFATDSGTSEATAFVSGVAALMMSHNPTFKHRADLVYHTLCASARDLTCTGEDQDGVAGPAWDPLTGHGLVNARNALQARVDILYPTASPVWYTGSGELDLSGLAIGIGTKRVTWSNGANGQQGVALVNDVNWAARVPLPSRTNHITISAQDSEGVTSTDSITVVNYGQGLIHVVTLTGDPLPDGSGYVAGALAPVLNNAGQAAFFVGMSGRADLASRGLLRFSQTPSWKLDLAARHGQVWGIGCIAIDRLGEPDRGYALSPEGGVIFVARSGSGQSVTGDVLFSPFDSKSLKALSLDGWESDGRLLGSVAINTVLAANTSNDTAFRGSTIGAGILGTTRNSLIRAEASGGGFKDIAWLGRESPDGNGRFDGLSNPSLNSRGQVGFVGHLSGSAQGVYDDEGIFLGDGTLLRQIARSRSNQGFSDFYRATGVPLNEGGEVAFVAGVNSGLDHWAGVYRSGSGLPVEIARSGLHIPGLPQSIYNLGKHVDLNDAGQVAFLALATGYGANGAFNVLARGDGTDLRVIAAVGQAIPGSAGKISDFSNYKFAMNSRGQLAFSAYLDDSRRALLIHDDAFGLLQIVSTRQAFLGSTLVDFEWRGTSDLGVLGQGSRGFTDGASLGFWFKLADNREGVALWNLPPVGITGVEVNGSDVHLKVGSLPGRRAVVQTSTQLTVGFVDLEAGLVLGGEEHQIITVTHLGGAVRVGSRFYRLRWMP